jgi:competence protein ComEA
MIRHDLALLSLLMAGVGFAAAAELNTASQAELESIRGIGPELSQRILEARRERVFSDWDDVMQRVRGAGKATVLRWSRQGLTVQGRPYATPPPANAASAGSR